MSDGSRSSRPEPARRPAVLLYLGSLAVRAAAPRLSVQNLSCGETCLGSHHFTAAPDKDKAFGFWPEFSALR